MLLKIQKNVSYLARQHSSFSFKSNWFTKIKKNKKNNKYIWKLEIKKNITIIKALTKIKR